MEPFSYTYATSEKSAVTIIILVNVFIEILINNIFSSNTSIS